MNRGLKLHLLSMHELCQQKDMTFLMKLYLIHRCKKNLNRCHYVVEFWCSSKNNIQL